MALYIRALQKARKPVVTTRTSRQSTEPAETDIEPVGRL